MLDLLQLPTLLDEVYSTNFIIFDSLCLTSSINCEDQHGISGSQNVIIMSLTDECEWSPNMSFLKGFENCNFWGGGGLVRGGQEKLIIAKLRVTY